MAFYNPYDALGAHLLADRNASNAPPQAPSAALGPMSAPDLSQLQSPVGKINNDPRGMFGVHGVPRDILGLLGDAFLVQSGHKPVYSAARQDEKEADAMGNFATDPLQAAQRLAAENPEAARDFYLKATDAGYRQRAQDEAYTGTVLDRALRMLGAANPDNYPQVKAQVEQYARARNVPLPMELPNEYNADAIQSMRKLAYPVDKQIDDENNQDYRGHRLDLMGDRLGLIERQIEQSNTNNLRNNNTSTANNERTTSTSSSNNIRSTGQSNTNNVRTTGVATRGQDIRDARAERTTGKQISSKVLNRDTGEVVITYKDGTVQTIHNSKPIGGKGGGRQPVTRAAPSGPPTFNNADDVRAAITSGKLKKGDSFKTPDGKTRIVP